MDLMDENQGMKTLIKHLVLVEVKACHLSKDGKKWIESVVGTASLDRGHLCKNNDGLFWVLKMSNKKVGMLLLEQYPRL
eukprot:scaffold4494_cov161-Amphora_coffeaeformis.AAC.5